MSFSARSGETSQAGQSRVRGDAFGRTGGAGALSKDPSKHKDDVVGSTDPKANEDAAKGSGFALGSKEDCGFKVGDHISDTDTATTLQQLSWPAKAPGKSHR